MCPCAEQKCAEGRLNSLVLDLRPCALRSPLNSQRSRRSVPHLTEESRGSERRSGLPRSPSMEAQSRICSWFPSPTVVLDVSWFCPVLAK